MLTPAGLEIMLILTQDWCMVGVERTGSKIDLDTPDGTRR
jgi:hypothetical protein